MNYLMESRDEIERLERKTGFDALRDQALWAGLLPGMRVADIGCGSGRTTSFLKEITGPDGEAVGIDRSPDRIAFARETYGNEGISFEERDIYGSLEGLGEFDFIWVRFLLEYHGEHQFDLVKSFSRLLAPGGILCLVDLDHNCINHHGQSPRLEKALAASMDGLVKHADFDPYAGRKLYSHMYDLNMDDIDVRVGTHHLIFGELNETDEYNWFKKITVALEKSGYDFPEYPGGLDEFSEECRTFFSDPRRFTYTPLIICRGTRPLESA